MYIIVIIIMFICRKLMLTIGNNELCCCLHDGVVIVFVINIIGEMYISCNNCIRGLVTAHCAVGYNSRNTNSVVVFII